MSTTNQHSSLSGINRRTALKWTLAASLTPFLPACSIDSYRIEKLSMVRFRKKTDHSNAWVYLEITTNKEVTGYGGPVFPAQAESLEKMLPQLNKVLSGRDPESLQIEFEWIWDQLYPQNKLSRFQEGVDPLSGTSIWNTRRSERHTPTGAIITGLSSVDNALWDLRGKIAGKPVYQLLGGTRERLRAYMSLRPDDDISEAVSFGKELFDQGQTAQKWFFRYGPPDGEEGFRKIVDLVEGLRTTLGNEAMLMFDFAIGQRGRCDWDVDYAIRVAHAIEPFKPTWLEEPFSPEEIESYRRLRGETGITLATGEHTYTRWNIRPFLEEDLVGYVQSDPEWCGGISELRRICDTVSAFQNVRVIPHGHHILAASHVVASQPESLCPMLEYGPNWVIRHQSAQARVVTPTEGTISTPQEPGLGPAMDLEQYEQV